MLQRIQTIYLFISTIVITLILFVPFFEFNSGGYVFDADSIDVVSQNVVSRAVNTIPIAILVLLCALITFVSIFLYKKRGLQMRLTVFSIILLLGVYVLIAFYRFLIIDFSIVSTTYSYGLIIPLIAAILNYMANRRIKKDDDLVKSVDRIR